MSKNFKKPRFEEEDNSNWIISYADMVTLLMCFFIIFSQVSGVSDTKNEEMKKQFSETFNKDEKSLTTYKPRSMLRGMFGLNLSAGIFNV